MQYEVELVVDAKATLGEGPCWDEENQLLYWVDIEGKNIHEYNPTTNENRSIIVEKMVGAIVLRKQGGAIVATENGFHFLNLKTGETEEIHDPENHLPNNRFNDGKCDPYGRFWAGTMDRYATKGKGALYCIDNNLIVSQKLDNVGISNGLAWSPDHSFMYYIDTLTKSVVRFDYDWKTGEIGNQKEVIRIPDGDGLPDGLTIDSEGNLWVAHWGGAKITNWNPVTGELLETISIPALNVTSCTFGGKDLDELYVTTARTGTDEKTLEDFPHAGGVFKVKTVKKGIKTYRFHG
ncbi:SMP-30/gluconolactonase/LRE family protein [Evansella sp. AB-rgal1]|uniref:SMP-30/gluconolactonase/LRE family protein n=1 Tax=Evansella sp. AB-rgal1 TaxID=3242696 RepID=UPI00359EF0FE